MMTKAQRVTYIKLALAAYEAVMADLPYSDLPTVDEWRHQNVDMVMLDVFGISYHVPFNDFSDAQFTAMKVHFERVRDGQPYDVDVLRLAVRANFIRQIRFLIEDYKRRYREEFDRNFLPILTVRFGAMFIEELEQQENLEELLNCLKTIKSRVLSAERKQVDEMNAEVGAFIYSGRELYVE